MGSRGLGLASLAALCFAGCVRAGFEGQPDGSQAPDARVDRADGETSPGDAAGDLLCAAGDFSTPQAVPNVNADNYDDWAPFLSANGLRLYFASWRAGDKSDLWVAARPSVSDTFGTPTLLANVNSSSTDDSPCLSGDELTLVFTSLRSGGKGWDDLWIARRTSVTGEFSAPVNLGELNSSDSDDSCHLDPAGLTIYFGSDRGGQHDIWTATRSSDTGPFLALTPLAGVNSPGNDYAPSLSTDGTEIFFASDRPGGMGGFDIWMAKRASPGGAFNAPVPVVRLNSALDDVEPCLSTDGLTIFFNHHAVKSGDTGPRADIWVTSRPCAP